MEIQDRHGIQIIKKSRNIQHQNPCNYLKYSVITKLCQQGLHGGFGGLYG